MSGDIIIHALPLLIKGALITIEASLAAMVIGLAAGTLLGTLNCQMLRSPVAGPLISAYIAVVRGTPLFIQLLIVYFALPAAAGVDLSPMTAGIMTLGLNSTAYLAEVVRGGINGIPAGQWEAGFVLGYTKVQTVRSIILPQAFYKILPALTNEMTTLIKESSILMVIGVFELTKASKDIVSRELKPLEIYLLAALFYFLMTSALSIGAKKLEKSNYAAH